MRALVIYESMYGHTHTLATRIGEGLTDVGGLEVEVVPVGDATAERVAEADLVVVGGPTHIHGMSTGMSRRQAVSEETLAHEADKGHELDVDPDAEGPGLRDWFAELGHAGASTMAAAFDTRLDASPALTGRASKGIARKLAHHGFAMIAPPESFVVDKTSELIAGEENRAATWAATLVAQVARSA